MLSAFLLTAIVLLVTQIYTDFAGDPWSKILGGLFFGIGLVVIAFMQLELFTSNVCLLSVSSFYKKSSFKDIMIILVISYVFNFIGAIITGGLLVQTGLATHEINPELFRIANAKATMPAWMIFNKAVWANIFVNIAVMMFIVNKSEVAKFISIIIMLFPFVYMGFEHSIANMGLFSIAICAGETGRIGGALYNILWATLGNIVGAVVFVALPVFLMNKTLDKA
jgi:nitrite transporter NirC